MQQLDYEKIGARIRRARKEKHWSQETLAEKCGISLSFMGHIERGTRNMSLETFVKLCEELQMQADELLWGVRYLADANLQGMFAQTKKKDNDNYSMYLRIMQSVAEIMSGT